MWKAGVFCFCICTACLLHTSCTIIGYEGKYVIFKELYSPDYETNTKYFGKADGFFSFKKLVETSRPNRLAKQGRFTLFDNTSTYTLTATILRLIANDSGNYFFGVDITLLPDLISDEIQLTVIRGKVQRYTTPAKVMVYSTSSPANITAHNRAKRDQESYSRFVTVLSLVCVCTLLVVCPFLVFQVKKWATKSKPSVSVLYHTRKTSAQVVDEYVKMSSVAFANSPMAQSDEGSVVKDFCRPTNTEAAPNTDACVGLALDLDQIYTEMQPDFVQESVYQSID